MFKLVAKHVWAFDAEWVPDPLSGRLAYDCAAEWDDDAVVEEMWRHGGATSEIPRPYLKTVLCRVVSVAAVVREQQADGSVKHRLTSLPRSSDGLLAERDLLHRFLSQVGAVRPQLVGFNSTSADLPALFQRALVNGLHLKDVCTRPNKPWEGVDYFAKGSDHNVDLKDIFGGWGKATPSLHEIATACGIPGKMGTDGASVVDLWRQGRIREIVQYNEYDAISTFLLWLRAAHLGGFITSEAYEGEQEQFEAMLRTRALQDGNAHLKTYVEQWERLRELRRGGGVQAIHASLPAAVPAEDAA